MRTLLDQMTQRQLKKKINKLDEDFQSPLHYAARYNHFEIVKILVERGASKSNLSIHFWRKKSTRLINDNLTIINKE
jgi:ankyrin repeat protein